MSTPPPTSAWADSRGRTISVSASQDASMLGSMDSAVIQGS